MDSIYYKFDQQKFAKLAKSFYTQKKAWKLLNLLSWFFVLLGLVPIVGMSILAFEPDVPTWDASVLLITGGLVLSVLPFCFAYITRSQATRHLGKPFSTMQQMFLYSNDTGIQFSYHDRYDFKSAASIIAHQIAYDNIHHVEVDQTNQLVTIVGRTERIEYSDYIQDQIDYRFTNGQFGDKATFSFFRCFENEQIFFNQLKAHSVGIRFL